MLVDVTEEIEGEGVFIVGETELTKGDTLFMIGVIEKTVGEAEKTTEQLLMLPEKSSLT